MKYVVSALLLLTVSQVYAQTPLEGEIVEASKPASLEVLKEALLVLGGNQPLVLKGRVTRESPDQGMGGVVVMSGGGSSAQPFSGNIEVVRPNKEAVLIASKSALPGFAVLEKDGREVRRMTTEREPVDVDEVSRDLLSIFDNRQIPRAIKKAEWKSTLNEKTGATTFTAKLGHRAIRRNQAGMRAMFKAKVIQVEFTAFVAKDGKLSGLKMKVVSNDPNAALRERALSGMGGGSIGIGEIEEAMEESQDIEGGSVTYDLQVTAHPSKRCKKTHKELEKIIDEIL